MWGVRDKNNCLRYVETVMFNCVSDLYSYLYFHGFNGVARSQKMKDQSVEIAKLKIKGDK
jgi:hypothetical protein